MIKTYKVKVEGKTYEVEVELLSQSEAPAVKKAAPAEVTSPSKSDVVVGTPLNTPIQGNIWKVLKKEGDHVQFGETVVILEAMKMEHNIVAPKDGVISSIVVKEGDSVDSGALLAKIS
ncbi:MAG: biotin/lipoyl-containing protein [Brevinema sp.]